MSPSPPHELRHTLAVLTRASELLEQLRPLEGVEREIRQVTGVGALLQTIQEQVVDTVIIDASTIPLDPVELVKRVTGAAPDLPIVVLTAETDSTLQLQLLGCGLAWVLPLVPSHEALDAALRRVVERTERVGIADRAARELVSWARATQTNLNELLHELRTPTSIVQGFCSNLLAGLEGPLGDGQRRALERIHTATELLAETLSEFRRRLPRTSAQADGPVLEARVRGRRRLRPGQLVAAVVALFEPAAAEGGIALAHRAVPDVPPIWGDRTRLDQLLVNLISNALRYTPAGGRITVEVAPAQLESKRGMQDACAIRVSDTGPGIPPHLQERVFERGFSGDQKRVAQAGSEGDSGRGDRAGLGLAICRQVAREHRGTLSLRSHADQGATFELIVPVDPRRRLVTVHIVDDENLAHRLLVELCRAGATPRLTTHRDARVLAARVLEGAASVLIGAGESEFQRLVSGSFPSV